MIFIFKWHLVLVYFKIDFFLLLVLAAVHVLKATNVISRQVFEELVWFCKRIIKRHIYCKACWWFIMSDYSSVAPPKNFSQSTAFAAALQRAKQVSCGQTRFCNKAVYTKLTPFWTDNNGDFIWFWYSLCILCLF